MGDVPSSYSLDAQRSCRQRARFARRPSNTLLYSARSVAVEAEAIAINVLHCELTQTPGLLLEERNPRCPWELSPAELVATFSNRRGPVPTENGVIVGSYGSPLRVFMPLALLTNMGGLPAHELPSSRANASGIARALTNLLSCGQSLQPIRLVCSALRIIRPGRATVGPSYRGLAALSGSFVPSLPVYGLVLPLVDQLSSFELLGSLRL